MIIMMFLAASAVLAANTLLLSYLIRTDHLTIAVSYSLFIGFLVIIVFLGISVPIILIIAKNVSSPVEKMLDKTRYDALTGIFNRRYVDENLKSLINFMSRSGGKLTVLMIDIDFFKEYNNKYGYNAGDNCLKFIANILSKTVSRSEDFVARYGGKEFVVVLPNTDENGAQVIAQRSLAVIRDCKIPHEINNAANFVTISIGAVTGTPEFSQSPDEYIKRAGEMLKKSIQDGCNRYSFETI